MESSRQVSLTVWSWIFPLTYLLHIAEEYWVGGGYPAYIFRLRGVYLSSTRFLLAQSIGIVLVVAGILLARRFKFRNMMFVILGATVLVNGLTHTLTSVRYWEYGPGLLTSLFAWVPLGVATLLHFKHRTTRRRYWIGVAIGVVINVAVGVITMKGGRLV
ncbi:MAG TPA: HXXEE domain-containing protein [Pyrinomonadaceae bacterium]|nr:HXXEE domain-containing protein [Pyrinomonadaceae bacterium]